MRAVIVTEAGGPEVLRFEERDDPVPGPGQAVVRLAAANINPTDLGARQGVFRPGFGIEGPPYVLGWDLAGEVVAVGDDVDGRAAGDPVVGMIPWYQAAARFGAYAELVLLEAQWLVDLPPALEPVDAATVPLNSLTALQALARLEAPPGSEILITSASGGVGSFAVQLAKADGLSVTAVAGSDDEVWVASLGADRVLARDADLSAIGTFSHVLDTVPIGEGVFPAAADHATIVTTRGVQETAGRGIDQRPMLIESNPAGLAKLVAQVAAGTLRTRVSETVPLAEAARGHELTEQPGRHGKVVLVS